MSDSWKKIEDLVSEIESESAGESNASAPSSTSLLEPEEEKKEDALCPSASEPEGADAPKKEASSPKGWGTSSPETNTDLEAPVIRSVSYTKKKRKTGRYKFAAPLGLFVILLAVTGVVTLGVLGIQAIQRSQDDTALRTELMDYFDPVIQLTPSPFEDVNTDPPGQLLEAAIWKVTNAERIRQLQEKDENSLYPLDDLSRMIIPLEKITEAYASLFGPDAKPVLTTIGDPGYSFSTEYFEEEGTFHVPYASSSSNYVAVLDTLTRKGDTYILRIGFVPGMDLTIDDKGNPISPTPDQAEYTRLFHVKKSGEEGWMLTAVSSADT